MRAAVSGLLSDRPDEAMQGQGSGTLMLRLLLGPGRSDRHNRVSAAVNTGLILINGHLPQGHLACLLV